jgi:hypothetical protein
LLDVAAEQKGEEHSNINGQDFVDEDGAMVQASEGSTGASCGSCLRIIQTFCSNDFNYCYMYGVSSFCPRFDRCKARWMKDCVDKNACADDSEAKAALNALYANLWINGKRFEGFSLLDTAAAQASAKQGPPPPDAPGCENCVVAVKHKCDDHFRGCFEFEDYSACPRFFKCKLQVTQGCIKAKECEAWEADQEVNALYANRRINGRKFEGFRLLQESDEGGAMVQAEGRRRR